LTFIPFDAFALEVFLSSFASFKVHSKGIPKGKMANPTSTRENGSLKSGNILTESGRMYSLILKADLKGKMDSK